MIRTDKTSNIKPIRSTDIAHSTIRKEETSQQQYDEGQLLTMPSSMNYGLLVSAILQQNDSSGD
jgi:hypothetical protein